MSIPDSQKKITGIKQQVKRAGRYSIFVDKKYSFSLSESELIASGIKIDRDYTDSELAELQQRAVLDKAYLRSLDLLARRARSEWELRDYLKHKEYEPNVVDSVVEKLSARGYINDQSFAESWVASRRLLKSTSQRKLALELKQKRVPESTIALVLEQDEVDERSVLRELIEKKRKQSRYKDDMKLMQYLSRQGFKYDDIRSTIQSQDFADD